MNDRAVHPNTRAMLQAWQRLAVANIREETLPLDDDYPFTLGRFFVLQRADDGIWPFRTVGESLNDLFGRELGGQDFIGLWNRHDASLVRAWLEKIRNADRPGLLLGRGETLGNKRVQIEIAVAPLDSPAHSAGRLLGLYQTLGGEPMLNGRPVSRHTVSAVYPPDELRTNPNLHLVVNNT